MSGGDRGSEGLDPLNPARQQWKARASSCRAVTLSGAESELPLCRGTSGLRHVFPWEMPHPQTRGSSPGCGFQAGTSLLQVLSCVWGTSCLLVQKVSGEGLGARKAGGGASMDLSSPDLPGLSSAGWVSSQCLPLGAGVTGDDVSPGWLGCEGVVSVSRCEW